MTPASARALAAAQIDGVPILNSTSGDGERAISDTLQRHRNFRSQRRALSVSGVVLIVLIPFWLWLLDVQHQIRRDDERGDVREVAQLHTSRLQQLFTRMEEELRALREFCERQIRERGRVDESAFAAFAEGLVSNSAPVQAVQLVEDNVITQTWPVAGNESVLGFDLSQSTHQDVARDVRRAYDQDEMTVTGPIPLLQGIQGLIIRRRLTVPPHGNTSAGSGNAATDDAGAGEVRQPRRLVAVVLALDRLLQDAGVFRGRVQKLQLAIRSAPGVAIIGPQEVFDSDPVMRLVSLPEGTWDLAVVPAAGWSPLFSSEGIVDALLSGVAVCLLVLLACAATIRTSNLSDAVAERTQELVVANRQLEEDLKLRRETEELLRQNESRLQSLLETETACIKVVSRDGTILDMNRSGLQMLECASLEEIQGYPLSRFVAPEFHTACQTLHEQVMAGAERELEFQIISLRGRRIWVETRAIPMTDSDGTISSALAITRDITETRNAQDALRNSERQFRSMFEQAAVGVVQYKASTGQVINLNERLCRMLKSDRASLQEKLMQDIFGEGYHDATSRTPGADDPQRPSTVHECEVARPDGSSLWLRLTSSTPSDHRQDYGNVTTVVEDVTQQRQDARTLVQRDRILNALAIAAARLLTSDDPMKVIDSVLRELGNATHSSRVSYFSRLPGHDDDPRVALSAEWCEEGIDRQIRREELKAIPMRSSGFARWDDLFAAGQPVRGPVREFPATESSPLTDQGILSLLALPVSQSRQWQGFLGFDDCVTERVWSDAETGALQIAAETLAAAMERRRTEDERKELIEQLAQSQKLEAVGQLAGGVAHDFNNMLQVILGYSDIGMSMAEDNAVLREIMTEIRTAARRSSEMTQQLLTFARRQHVEPSRMDLNRAIPNLLKLLQRMVGENIRLKWVPGPSACHVIMEPTQLDQILTNLVVNARDAISGTGTVTISTAIRGRSTDGPGDDSDIHGQPFVVLNVTDDGCGMSPNLQSRVFEPFFTTKAVGEGSGLGLSNVYGIVQQNNGSISVTSAPGRGSTFSIRLPMEQSEAARLAVGDPGESLPHGGETVVLVEDEPMVLDFGAQLLEQLGYHVITFRSPMEALSGVDQLRDNADLLVTDVVMPDMDGRELARRLMQVVPDLRCLFISGFAPETLISHTQSDRDVSEQILVKPFSARELAEKVREILDQELTVPP